MKNKEMLVTFNADHLRAARFAASVLQFCGPRKDAYPLNSVGVRLQKSDDTREFKVIHWFAKVPGSRLGIVAVTFYVTRRGIEGLDRIWVSLLTRRKRHLSTTLRFQKGTLSLASNSESAEREFSEIRRILTEFPTFDVSETWGKVNNASAAPL